MIFNRKKTMPTIIDIAIWKQMPTKWYKIEKVLLQRYYKKWTFKYFIAYLKYFKLRVLNK